MDGIDKQEIIDIAPTIYHYGDVVFVKQGDNVSKMTVAEFDRTQNLLSATFTPEAATELKTRLSKDKNLNEQTQGQLDSVLSTTVKVETKPKAVDQKV